MFLGCDRGRIHTMVAQNDVAIRAVLWWSLWDASGGLWGELSEELAVITVNEGFG